MLVTQANLATFVEHGLLSGDMVPDILGRITTTQSVEEAAENADFVIESIAEKIEAKKALYEVLNSVCPSGPSLPVILPINIYEAMPGARLSQTVIAHWFAPPHIVPLVEVVKVPRRLKPRWSSSSNYSRRSVRSPLSWRGSFRVLYQPVSTDHRPGGLLSARQTIYDRRAARSRGEGKHNTASDGVGFCSAL
jgi:hypothetical protein